MHIKKNTFEDIFNKVIYIKGKTKNNIKARMDIIFFCDRWNMKLVNDRARVVKAQSHLCYR
jgi:hypothetical protein